MIRRIICPSDLSPAAQNAAAYAAKLCQLTGATLELIHSEPVSGLQRVFAGRRADENTLLWAQTLNDQANELNKLFKISCSADIDTHNMPLAELIEQRADAETLIVMGTNGADTGHQQFFGSNAYNLAMARCPNLLIIPENVSFRTITRIALTWDYHLSENMLKNVSVLAEDLKAKLLFVHISRHAATISEDVYRARRSLLREKENHEGESESERVSAEDIEQGLLEFMTKDVADILVVPVKNGRLVRHFFGAVDVPEHLPSFPVLITS